MINLPKHDGLNIVPFIDVMLVLLAITLSASTFITNKYLEVDLPDSKQGANLPKKQNKLIIQIDENNEFYMDRQKSSIDLIKERISSLPKEDVVEINSDKKSSFENFIKIINVLKETKHTNFLIATKTEP